MVLGIRLCGGQQVTEWNAMAEEGIRFVIFPVSLGEVSGEEKERLCRQIQECRQAGMEWGLYVRMPVSEWETKTEAWRALVDACNRIATDRKRGLRILLDVTDAEAIYCLNREELCKGIGECCIELQTAGVQPMLFGSKYWHTVFLNDEKLKNCPRWVTQYHRECTYTGRFDVWEFTSAYRMSGIEGMIAVAELYPPHLPEETLALPKLNGYIGNSLAGALNRIGYPSDFQSRQRLAVQLGYKNTPEGYTGSAEQNRELIRLLGGTVSQSRILREGAYIRILPEAGDAYTGRRFEPAIYNNTFQVISVSGSALVFGIWGKALGVTVRNGVYIVN